MSNTHTINQGGGKGVRKGTEREGCSGVSAVVTVGIHRGDGRERGDQRICVSAAGRDAGSGTIMLAVAVRSCRLCGSTGRLHRHRTTPFGLYVPANIMILCPKHHKTAHKVLRKQKHPALTPTITVPVLRETSRLVFCGCQQCNHEWMPRQSEINRCPRCQSLKWDDKKAVKK